MRTNLSASQVLFNSFLIRKTWKDLIKLSGERRFKMFFDIRPLYEFWYITQKDFKELNYIAVIKNFQFL